MKTVITNPGGTIPLPYYGKDAVAITNAGLALYTVAAGHRSRPQSLIMDITNTATVGNRVFVVSVYAPAGGLMWRGPASGNVAASQVCGYDINFGNNNSISTTVRRNIADTANTNVQVTASCPIMDWPPGYYIVVDDVANIDPADSVTAHISVVEYDV